MKTRRYMQGLSLIEMLIVLGLIALLATMIIGVASRIDSQSKEKGVESVFVLLEAALEEYKEFQGDYPLQPVMDFTSAAAHSEYLYAELYSVPDSRKILVKISDSLIENKFGTADSPAEIYDPWSTALEYRYAPGDNFPKFISAGPDAIFDNTDDINNR